MEESFRDHVSHIDAEGHRVFFHPKKPHGKFYNWRTILSYGYLITFFSLPFLRIHGNPLFLFDLLERRYILFGVRFWPQDFSFSLWACLLLSFSLRFSPSSSVGYFAVGSAHKPFLWKWFFAKLNIG